MKQRRAKNLSDDGIKIIVEILDGWTGKLTWELLISEISLRRHGRYTRQALSNHERIRHAFDLKKRKCTSESGLVRPVCSPELKVAMGKIERLKSENIRLESENQRLLEQFATWTYNAYSRGLDQEFLNHPLPSINRGQTILPKKHEID